MTSRCVRDAFGRRVLLFILQSYDICGWQSYVSVRYSTNFEFSSKKFFSPRISLITRMLRVLLIRAIRAIRGQYITTRFTNHTNVACVINSCDSWSVHHHELFFLLVDCQFRTQNSTLRLRRYGSPRYSVISFTSCGESHLVVFR